MILAKTYLGLRPLAFCALCACGTFPDVDGLLTDADRALPYPVLQPIDPLLARVAALGDVQPQTQTAPLSIDARIAKLNARADALRRPVIESNIRKAMRRGVAVPAAIR